MADRTEAPTLDSIGLRYEVKQASNQSDLLRQHQTMIESLTVGISDIVLVAGVGAVGLANTYAEYLPDATVHLLSVYALDDAAADLRPNVKHRHCASIQDRTRYLMAIPAPQLIIENGNNHKGQKLACFRQLSMFLAAGGLYVVEELRAVTIAKLDDHPGDHILGLLNRLNLLRVGAGTPEHRDDTELARSIDAITFGTNVAYVRKGLSHRIKLRDRDANEILQQRFGSSWGTVLRTLPAHEFPSVTQVINHGEGPVKHRKLIKVPERSLRQYERVICQHRQRMIVDGYYLPDTFRHPLQSRLNHRELVNATPHVDRSAREPEDTERLDGQYFSFDTEYPGHFGHVTTEVLGRYWGWQAARELNPQVRPLISLDPGQDAIPGFQKMIFEALDIPVSEITYIRPGVNVEVESLIAASPQFAMPQYADDSLAEVWAQIASRLRDRSFDGPELIFSSRRPGKIRSCLNVGEVEDFFAGLGFTVLFPEDYSFAEQVNLFAGARVIAGFGGSNMFCTMFAPGATKIIISGESYTANNEQLIAAVAGGDLHYVWGRSEIAHPEGGWSWPAFQSNFTVELSRYDRELRALI